VQDTLAGRNIVVQYDPENRSASAALANGDRLPAVSAFWFAWHAFHPGTAVYHADDPGAGK
jgi:hypothetical protein